MHQCRILAVADETEIFELHTCKLARVTEMVKIVPDGTIAHAGETDIIALRSEGIFRYETDRIDGYGGFGLLRRFCARGAAGEVDEGRRRDGAVQGCAAER